MVHRKSHDFSIGARFGEWEILDSVAIVEKGNQKYFARCSCGKEKFVYYSQLIQGSSKSCGCLRKRLNKQPGTKHGMSNSRTYDTWKGMFQRCKNQSSARWYRDKGIKVCRRWKKFENFLKDMGEIPEGYSIDRIDGDLGYFKENCRYVDVKTQQRNKKCNRFFEIDGKVSCVAEIAEHKGVDLERLRSRLNKCKWDIDLSLKARKGFRKDFGIFDDSDRPMSLADFCREHDFPYMATYHLVTKKSFSLDQVFEYFGRRRKVV